MAEILLSETDGHVRILTLNRPEARNALSAALRCELTEAFLSAGADPEIRAIVLTGAGDKAFCAGADLKETPPPDAPPGELSAVIDSALRLFQVVGGTERPVIAALNGVAVGGGLELALACDIRLAVKTASIGLPEAKVGMGATYGSIVLPRIIPPGIAYEVMFSGRSLSAGEAVRWGLVNRLVPPGELLSAAVGLAQDIAGNAPLTTRRMKAISRAGRSLDLDIAVRLDVGPNPYLSEDRLEGAMAFREKRKPVWRGR